MPIATELELVPALVQWLAQQVCGSAGDGSGSRSVLAGRIDLDRLAVAGHSRGGKLASLLYTGGLGAAWEAEAGAAGLLHRCALLPR